MSHYTTALRTKFAFAGVPVLFSFPSSLSSCREDFYSSQFSSLQALQVSLHLLQQKHLLQTRADRT